MTNKEAASVGLQLRKQAYSMNEFINDAKNFYNNNKDLSNAAIGAVGGGALGGIIKGRKGILPGAAIGGVAGYASRPAYEAFQRWYNNRNAAPAPAAPEKPAEASPAYSPYVQQQLDAAVKNFSEEDRNLYNADPEAAKKYLIPALQNAEKSIKADHDKTYRSAQAVQKNQNQADILAGEDAASNKLFGDWSPLRPLETAPGFKKGLIYNTFNRANATNGLLGHGKAQALREQEALKRRRDATTSAALAEGISKWKDAIAKKDAETQAELDAAMQQSDELFRQNYREEMQNSVKADAERLAKSLEVAGVPEMEAMRKANEFAKKYKISLKDPDAMPAQKSSFWQRLFMSAEQRAEEDKRVAELNNEWKKLRTGFHGAFKNNPSMMMDVRDDIVSGAEDPENILTEFETGGFEDNPEARKRLIRAMGVKKYKDRMAARAKAERDAATQRYLNGQYGDNAGMMDYFNSFR